MRLTLAERNVGQSEPPTPRIGVSHCKSAVRHSGVLWRTQFMGTYVGCYFFNGLLGRFEVHFNVAVSLQRDRLCLHVASARRWSQRNVERRRLAAHLVIQDIPAVRIS